MQAIDRRSRLLASRRGSLRGAAGASPRPTGWGECGGGGQPSALRGGGRECGGGGEPPPYGGIYLTRPGGEGFWEEVWDGGLTEAEEIY